MEEIPEFIENADVICHDHNVVSPKVAPIQKTWKNIFLDACGEVKNVGNEMFLSRKC
jgi:hypothetical protein